MRWSGIAALVVLGATAVVMAVTQTPIPGLPKGAENTSVERDWVVTERWAYVLLPPIDLGPGEVEGMWSHDGSRFVFIRPSGNQVEVMAYQRGTPRPRALFTLPAGHEIESLMPLGPDRVMVRSGPVAEDAQGPSLSDLVAVGSNVQRLGRLPANLVLEPSPNGQFFTALLWPIDGSQAEVQLLDINLQTRARALLPGGLIGSPDWTVDGRPIFRMMSRNPGQPRVLFQTFDASGRGLVTLPQVPQTVDPSEARHPLVIEEGEARVQGPGRSLTLPALWLTTEGEPRTPRTVTPRDGEPVEQAVQAALISVEAETASISPAGDAVVYSSRGVLYVRPVARMDKALFQRLVNEVEKQRAISDAKQAAVAVLIYSADYDDVFPDGTDFVDKVHPYIRSRQILERFVYTFGGGDITKINDPSNQEIGFIVAPGGRAVAYADGSVRWIDDKRP